MQESFIHYLWQFQYFDKKDLKTTNGESLSVFQTGSLNTDAGPDFSSAKVKIDSMDWMGSVEMHTKSSGWYDHGHDSDPAYEKVVLHVVWVHDKPVTRNDGTELPTLELQHRVDPGLIENYKRLVENSSVIPCEKLFPEVSEITKLSMLDRSLMQRLETKAAQVSQLLESTQNDWEEVTYQLMARNFGFKINYDPFFQLANAIPRKILLKHADSLRDIEALLFGQGGFLDYGIKDEYFKDLQQEYKALASKYGLENQKLRKEDWKFLRLRPANFPTIRIAQFSALFFRNRSLFAKLMEATQIKDITKLFDVNTSEYWHTHYRFGRKTARSISGMGEESVHNIIINTIAPLLVAYGKAQDDQNLIDRAVDFLQKTPAEKNKITKTWASMNLQPRQAFDSQALIELNNNFCLKRRCLDCNIGIDILKPAKT
ncbi:MAG: DUF2851 family protein [Cyclobacteriaceae bacterium]|nr:DUF2851 family protein [Cyclobacteriaceae bacterium]